MRDAPAELIRFRWCTQLATTAVAAAANARANVLLKNVDIQEINGFDDKVLRSKLSVWLVHVLHVLTPEQNQLIAVRVMACC